MTPYAKPVEIDGNVIRPERVEAIRVGLAPGTCLVLLRSGECVRILRDSLEVSRRLGLGGGGGDAAAAPEAIPPVEAGQVRGESGGATRVYVIEVDAEGWARYRFSFSDGTWDRPHGRTTPTDLAERYPVLLDPALGPPDVKAAAASPPPPDPVALLAAGRRLRFVRDEPINDRLPPAIDGKLIKPHHVHLIAFNPPGEPIRERGCEHLFCSDWNCTPHTTALYVPKMLDRLGYRLDSVVEDDPDDT